MVQKHPKVLIVEDEQNWLEMHEFSLGEEGLGFNVSATDNLHQALKDMDKFDCVLVDGLEGLWEKFADKGREKGIRVIVISGQSEQKEAGFRDLVTARGAEFLNKNVFIFQDSIVEYKKLAETIKGVVRGSKEAPSF